MSSVVEFPGWRSRLVKGDKGTLPTSGNAMIMLDGEPHLRGMLGYDELADRPVLLRAPPPAHEDQAERSGPYPRPWQAADVEIVLAFMQHETPRFTRDTVKAAMGAVASTHRFHPIRKWLSEQRWDGRERLTHWLVQTFGAPPTGYVKAVGRAFLVAAVRRVMQPGCKFDCMLVLEGKQGIGKSSSLAALFGQEWFTDRLPRDLDSPDAIRAMLGKWGVEMAENDQIIRGGVETINAFLSRSTDRIVPKYENEARDIPRQCVIVGTTNRDDYLRDTTGNRRFWPVECVSASPNYLKINRDQLWAEACVIEAAGADVWLTDPAIQQQAQEMQEGRVIDDTWDERIAEWVADHKGGFSMAKLLYDGLGILVREQDRRAQLRAGDCLRRLGWRSTPAGRGGDSKGRLWRQVIDPATKKETKDALDEF